MILFLCFLLSVSFDTQTLKTAFNHISKHLEFLQK